MGTGSPILLGEAQMSVKDLHTALQEDSTEVLLKQSWAAFPWCSLNPLFRFQQNPLLMKQKQEEETMITLNYKALQALCCKLSEPVVV